MHLYFHHLIHGSCELPKWGTILTSFIVRTSKTVFNELMVFFICYRDLTMSNQIVLSTKRRGLPSTSSSSATATNTTTVSADLASLFECPVCFDYVLPPILQCQSGHLVCSNCRPKLTCCPTCRGPLGECTFCCLPSLLSLSDILTQFCYAFLIFSMHAPFSLPQVL